MFSSLGIQWASTLLGGIAAVLIPIPVLFYMYGHKLRKRSKFAPTVSPKTPLQLLEKEEEEEEKEEEGEEEVESQETMPEQQQPVRKEDAENIVQRRRSAVTAADNDVMDEDLANLATVPRAADEGNDNRA